MDGSGGSPVPNRPGILEIVIFNENAEINDFGSLGNETCLEF
jgi:hypothetical protein